MDAQLRLRTLRGRSLRSRSQSADRRLVEPMVPAMRQRISSSAGDNTMFFAISLVAN